MATTNSSFLFGFWAEKMSERWRRRGWGEGNFRRVQMGRKAPIYIFGGMALSLSLSLSTLQFDIMNKIV